MADEESLEDRLLNVVEGVIESQHNFLNPQTLRLIPYADRPSLVSRFLSLNAALTEMMIRTYTASVQARNTAAAILTYTLPTGGNSFFDAIPVVPTQNQMDDALVDEPNPTGNCAICQEQVSSSAVKIRQCGHVFHRTCISQWFRSSVRCPVCRQDIRERRPSARATQTPSASEQT